uniref:RRM domain-containing protein n=1 Tax=Eptatretus burgeri TaxID=7764 RepID=A0A8C4NK23_EPTBU
MSKPRDQGPLDCKVYVGNLGFNASEYELEKVFSYYGPVRSVWIARNPPGFAFVQFEEPRDARDACRELDGRILCGTRARVEMSTGVKRQKRWGPAPPWTRSDYRRRTSSSPVPSSRRSPARRSRSRSLGRARSPFSPPSLSHRRSPSLSPNSRRGKKCSPSQTKRSGGMRTANRIPSRSVSRSPSPKSHSPPVRRNELTTG